MTASSLTLIAKRRAAIEQERLRLQQALKSLDAEQAKLAAEEHELEIAERVLGRLGDTPAEQTAAMNRIIDEVEEVAAAAAKDRIPRIGKPRPEGIPTVRAMIDQLLMEAEREGKDGLKGRALVVGIGNRWWPGVGWNSVLPTAIRLVKSKHLGRSGDLYIRVDEKGHLRSKMPLRGVA